jgi:hypothetical protein
MALLALWILYVGGGLLGAIGEQHWGATAMALPAVLLAGTIGFEWLWPVMA